MVSEKWKVLTFLTKYYIMFPSRKRSEEDMSSIDIGNKVKELMKKNKMTNLELAKLLNIEEQELSEKLSGKEEFLATEATKISNIFKISINDFANIFFNTNKEKI